MSESSRTLDRTSVVVLGGYGNFGRRIVAALADDSNNLSSVTKIYIVGRDIAKAKSLATELGGCTEGIELDHHAENFAERLRALHPKVLIHTAGPFQEQDYAVAKACIAAGCHYVDIADGRQYVSSIDALDADAKSNEVLIVSGASSLPALSSAVIDAAQSRFARLDSIEHAISAGAKPPGLGTMNGVLGYIGKPFTRWKLGQWQTIYGWQDAIALRFPNPIGKRWVANCDVPDLELFPKRYPQVQSVAFRAGLGFASTTLATWALSWLVRAGVIKTLLRYAKPLLKVALLLEPIGSKWSAMRVHLTGIDSQGEAISYTWTLLAGNNHGPSIPCCPAIALARKLLRDEISLRGAMSCMGLLTVDEILNAIPGLELKVIQDEHSGFPVRHSE